MRQERASRWLPYRSVRTDIGLRVFCLPHAGGGASAFHSWTSEQPPGVEICAVQLPGREDRIHEPCAEDLVELARLVASALLPNLDVPYAVVGNSMGALLGFELARYLQQRYDLPPVRLVAAATRPPGAGLCQPPVSGLADEDLAAAIAGRHGGVPREILSDSGHLAAFLPAMRADLAMLEAYTPAAGPVLTCPITALAGTADPVMSLPDLVGWSAFTDGGFDSAELSGDHFALLRHPDDVIGPLVAQAALVQPPGPRSRLLAARQAAPTDSLSR